MATVRKGYERRKSTGDILLPVPADVAPFEQSNKASEAYPKGSFFYYNNTFYEATSAISAGGTISPGSNCTAKTVAQVLYELNGGGGSAWTSLGTKTSYTLPSQANEFLVAALRGETHYSAVFPASLNGTLVVGFVSGTGYITVSKSGSTITASGSSTFTVYWR